MIELVYDAEKQRADLKRKGYYISNAKGAIETSVLISLLSDADWWGGSVGSGLVLLIENGKLDASTVGQIESEARNALQWMITDGVASSVSVVASKMQSDTLLLECIVTRATNNEPAIVKIVWEAYSNGT